MVAAAVVVVAGMPRHPPDHRTGVPALVLTIIEPATRLDHPSRRTPLTGHPGRLLAVIAIVTGLLVAAVIGLAQLAALIPQYAGQIQDTLI
ncbi:MAG TPA: hypothetical protein VIT42_18985 [Microlunatus sp.]